jgi:GT2 family glycosyltransferase
MDLSIIIVNWNSADYVKKCLGSLSANTTGVEHEIIVVDNGSYDSCENMIAHNFPAVRFFQSKENRGFGRANNFGADQAEGEYLMFLNPDTEVVNSAVSEMLTVIKSRPRAGVLGCKLLNSDMTTQTSCIQPFPTIVNQLLDARILHQLFPRFPLWGIAPLFTDGKEPADVQVISGACMMIRKAVFQKVGGFSSEYFMYTEDIDLCHKVQRAGYNNYYIGLVSIIHHGGGSSHLRKDNFFADVQMRESISKFLKKTRGKLYSSLYRGTMFLAGVIRLFVTLLAFIPCMLTGRYARCKASFKKWIEIVKWSLGLSSLAL